MIQAMHIDWSLGAGPIWLAIGMAVFYGLIGALVVSDAAAD
jgi:hypothetical protein